MVYCHTCALGWRHLLDADRRHVLARAGSLHEHLGVEVVAVARDEDVDVAHDLEHVNPLHSS